MIGIKLEDEQEFLETEPDTRISIKLENPIFGNAEKLSPGSFSLPFSIPAGERSVKNSRLLRDPDVVENAESYKIQRATIFWDGVPFKSGNLKPREYDAGRSSVNAHFTFGLNSISPDLKTARMRDILDDEQVISAAGVEKAVYIKPIGAGDRTITVNGQSYTDDSVAGIGVLINTYFDDNIILDGPLYLPRATLVASGDPTPNGITPIYVIIRMARVVTSTITGLPILEFSTDPHIELNVVGDYDKWEIEADLNNYYDDFVTYFASFVSAPPNNKIRWPLMFNANIHDGEILKPVDVVNAYDANCIQKNEPNFGQLFVTENGFVPRNYNSIQPFLMMKHVLDTIATTFGFEWEGDFYDDPDTAAMLIDNAVCLDIPMPLVGEKKFIFWRRSFNLSELVEDITVIDFLKKLQGRFNLAIYYNEETGKVRACYREPIAKAYAYEDITARSSPVMGLTDERVAGFGLIVPKDPDDAFSVDEKLNVSTPEVPLQIDMGRLHLTKTAVINGKTVSGPWVSRPASDKFRSRIFYYTGVVDNGTYEYGSADITAGQDSLPALYSVRWKYWLLAQMNRQAVKIGVRFELRDLMQLNWELKRRFDRSNFLIKSIDFELSNWNVTAKSVELYSM